MFSGRAKFEFVGEMLEARVVQEEGDRELSAELQVNQIWIHCR